MINWYRALRTIGKPIGNPTIELPVKILWGAQDRFLASEMAELSLGYCPKGQLTLLPEASHWLLIPKTPFIVLYRVNGQSGVVTLLKFGCRFVGFHS